MYGKITPYLALQWPKKHFPLPLPPPSPSPSSENKCHLAANMGKSAINRAKS